jgi:eukaryotic-like serine/threonine-protein kinase
VGDQVFTTDSGASYRVLGAARAHGGFASVYCVEDHTGARHALKRLRLWGLPARLLAEEADHLRRIDHEHVIRYHDWGTKPAPFLVMELADSGSLRDVVGRARERKQPLALDEVLDWGGQVLGGLAAVHRCAIHCDIKADNVLLQGPTAKLADLGSARAFGGPAAGRPLRTAPAYKPPEAWLEGDAVRPAPTYDLYGVGIILVFLATLRLPFVARRLEDVGLQHLFAAPPHLRALRPDVPPELEQLVCDLLAKDPARRPQSAQDALGRLRQVRASLSRAQERYTVNPAIGDDRCTGA